MEIVDFFKGLEQARILEITNHVPQLASQLSNDTYTLDLCVLNNSEIDVHSLAGYHHLFFQLEAINTAYDVVIIPSLFDYLTKDEGYQLLNQLLQLKAKEKVVLVSTNPNKQKWLIPDFVNYDFSFYRLPESEQLLIKFYPASSSTVQLLPPLTSIHQKLSILYVVPHQSLTGGMKMLYEQMKALQKRGHQITVMIRGDFERVVPEWVEDFTPDQEIIVPSQTPYLSQVDGIDIIFAGFYSQISELKNKEIPVLYWEQGHEYLYGDVSDITLENAIRERLKQQFSQDIYYATDSSYVHDIVKNRFAKDSYILPIFIDTNFYYPMDQSNHDLLTILLVGNPGLTFKGFVLALQVLIRVWSEGYRFKVVWACQLKPSVQGIPFEIDYRVNVSQTELAQIYRESDILLSCSMYEGCPMPPLEAMASGLAVIATNCGGINQYARHEENALIAKDNTLDELAAYVKKVLTDIPLRQRLIQNGKETAKSLNYENGVLLLEQILQTVVDDFSHASSSLVHPKRIKVLFLIGTLLGGGAEKVLLNLVKALNPTLFDITVQTIFDEGIYIEEIKKYVTYKTIYKRYAKITEVEEVQNYQRYLNTLWIDEFANVVIDDDYDLEVAFLEESSTRIIGYTKHEKAKKIAWVHTDFSNNNAPEKCFDSFEEQKYCYEQFHQIVCVSDQVKEGFINRFGMKEKVCVRYNPINESEIKEKSQLPISTELSSEFKIVSIGRLAGEKGYQRLIEVVKKLREWGFFVELIIIGEGIRRADLEAQIKKEQLEDCVTLTGYLENPYALASQCQLFVCSSYVEGLSSAIIEAFILGLPVIATNCGGAKELLGNGEYGLLVDNDANGLFYGIYSVLIDQALYEHLKNQSVKRGKFFNYQNQTKAIEDLLLTSI